ncbi:MAG: site-specific integrase [Chloroflexi bacterium]|nr:site-specific integrase [Chloroflexota bacterium]
MRTQAPNALALALRDFFADYLPGMKGFSPHTVRSYRDALVLLLRYLAVSTSRDPAALDLDIITPEVVIGFLAHLEKDRHNNVATRNVRLAAIHAFFRFVAAQRPDRMEQAQRILGVPFKRARSEPIDYLEYDEIEAVLNQVDRSTADGRRDYALMALMFNSGARVQELLDVRVQDLQLVRPFQVRLRGKGQRVRICPLWPQTAQVLRAFCEERQLDLDSSAPLFLNQWGRPLTRFGVRYILAKHCQRATATVPNLSRKRLHPHSMRHSTAVHLLKAGVDLATISHWLGHASINTTNKYATIDLQMKREAIARVQPPGNGLHSPKSWRSDASVLEWLESL